MSRKALSIAIWALFAGIMLWDLYLWLASPENTISRAIVDFFAEHPPWVFLFGFLCGHLAWPLRPRRKSCAKIVRLPPS